MIFSLTGLYADVIWRESTITQVGCPNRSCEQIDRITLARSEGEVAVVHISLDEPRALETTSDPCRDRLHEP